MINKNHKGFTLIELLIVIAILGILFSIVAPKYSVYTKKAKFLEIVMAASSYKMAAEIAVQVNNLDVSNLNDGEAGIPKNVPSSNDSYEYIDTISMKKGVITIVSKNIDKTNPTYILNAVLKDSGRISWVVDKSSTCLLEALCTSNNEKNK
jgi:type IV pilus assembly protein PilA